MTMRNAMSAALASLMIAACGGGAADMTESGALASSLSGPEHDSRSFRGGNPGHLGVCSRYIVLYNTTASISGARVIQGRGLTTKPTQAGCKEWKEATFGSSPMLTWRVPRKGIAQHRFRSRLQRLFAVEPVGVYQIGPISGGSLDPKYFHYAIGVR